MAKAPWSWKDCNRQHGDQAEKPGAADVVLQPEPAPALESEPVVEESPPADLAAA